MKNSICRDLCLVFSFLLCGASLLNGQEVPTVAGEFRIGLSGGVACSFHPGIFSGERGLDYPGIPIETSVKTKPGYSIGITANYLLTDIFSISTRILYSTRPGAGTSRLSSSVLLPVGDTVKLIDQVVQQETEVRYNLLEADLTVRALLLRRGKGGAGIALGLSAGYPVTLEDNLSRRLIASADQRFVNPGGLPTRDSGRVLVFAENEDRTDDAPLRLSLRSGLFYDLSLFDRFHVTPGAYFDYGLTPVVRNTGWKMNAWMFQLDFTMAL